MAENKANKSRIDFKSQQVYKEWSRLCARAWRSTRRKATRPSLGLGAGVCHGLATTNPPLY